MLDNWFTTWFASPYYHKLYSHRDENEARLFIDHLINYFNPEPDIHILDVGCGYGRHSKYLSEKGFRVKGIDINRENIEYAAQFENEKLKFYVHDMRESFNLQEKFDLVLNLFTSFGYFKDENDNQKTINNFSSMLKNKGLLIIDFINAKKAVNELKPFDVVEKEGIIFNISKYIQNGFIVKNIRFTDNGKEYSFQEYVRALTLEDFKVLFKKSSLELKKVFGNYALNAFDPENSERLILITEKQNNA